MRESMSGSSSPRSVTIFDEIIFVGQDVISYAKVNRNMETDSFDMATSSYTREPSRFTTLG